MSGSSPVAAVLGACVLAAACSPTFDWREVRIDTTGLKAMLPCKPDKGAREVSMAGRPVRLQGLGCDTGGATFAVMFADLGDASQSTEVLSSWNQATLGNLRATGAEVTPFLPPGAMALGTSAQVRATGQRADGQKVESRAAYFARGGRVFQAVVFADRLNPEFVEPFFQGLRFE
jgi:hypothetical protein